MKLLSIRSSFFAFVSILQISLLLATPFQTYALFGKPKVPNPRTEIRGFLEEDLNVSVSELSTLTEGVNIADLKGEIARIDISFDNPHPKEGEIVTATAAATSLKSPANSYFTWYIRNENEDAGSLEQYKIDAVQRHAATFFDPLRFDEPFNGGNGDGIVTLDEYPEGDFNTDNHQAIIGGTNAGGKEDYCYVHDRQSGEQLELVDTDEGETGLFNCPNGKSPVCLVPDRTEQCPVLIQAIEASVTASSSAAASADTGSDSTATITAGEDSPRTAPLLRCAQLGVGKCQDDGVVCATPGAIAYCEPEVTPDTAIVDQNTCPTPELYQDLPGGQYETFEGGCPGAAELSGMFPAECEYRGDEFYEEHTTCDQDIHLFPRRPETADGEFGRAEEFFWGLDSTSTSTTPHGLDEEFVAGLGVTSFKWRYREGDQIGVVAEGLSTVAAKHENSSEQVLFLFVKGCNLDYGRSSYLSDLGDGKSALIQTIDMGREELNECVMFKDGSGNLVNFISPGESDRSDLEVEILGGDPNFTLQNSVGHIFSAEGNVVNKGDDSEVGSSQASYRWSFACHPNEATLRTQTTASTTTTGPINITRDLVDAARTYESLGNELPFENVRQVGAQVAIEGSNLTKISIPLELPQKCFDNGATEKTFMRVRLIVNEPGKEANQTNYGRQDQIYPISDSPAFIQTFLTSVAVSEDTAKATRTEEICGAPTGGGASLDYALCRVVSGEILGLHVPGIGGEQNVQWRVDGEDVFCAASDECNRQQDTVFIPVIGDSEDTILINATINDPTKPDDVITISRVLRIVDPEINIIAVEGTQFKELGEYIDIEGNDSVPPTYSDKLVEFTDSVSLEVETTPPFVERDIEARGGFIWDVNGEEVAVTSQGSFSFVPEKIDGVRTSATIKVTGQLNLPNADRIYLKRQFGVSQFGTSQRLLEHTVKAQELAAVTSARINGSSDTLFANVLTSAPQYFLFLLKLVLIVSIMLFTSAIVFSVAGRRS